MARRTEFPDIPQEDLAMLERWAAGKGADPELSDRARIVLRSIEFYNDSHAGRVFGVPTATVSVWRRGFGSGGPKALLTAARRTAAPERKSPERSPGFGLARFLENAEHRGETVPGSMERLADADQAPVLEPVGLYLGPPECAVVAAFREPGMPEGPYRLGGAFLNVHEEVDAACTGSQGWLVASIRACAKEAAMTAWQRHHIWGWSGGKIRFLDLMTRLRREFAGQELRAFLDGSRPLPDYGSWLNARPEVTFESIPEAWDCTVGRLLAICGEIPLGAPSAAVGADFAEAVSEFVGTYDEKAAPYVWMKLAPIVRKTRTSRKGTGKGGAGE
ncbi:MAG: helix-turn-helix domain containing protein [Deltaproteobacteria bacterium]|jgi:hypothetical protein|nr:helix-turn-helix domain containing protein [Deltaproteobacteria bacterium]